MAVRTVKGKKIPIKETRASAHGFTNKLDNDLFVAGVKLKQAQEKLQDSAKAGKPHEKLSRLSVQVQKAQLKHDKLMQKKIKRDKANAE